MTHHTTTQQEIIDIKCVFQSYYMKKYILIHFEIQKKLIVVGLFLLLAGFRGPQANFTGRSLTLRTKTTNTDETEQRGRGHVSIEHGECN